MIYLLIGGFSFLPMIAYDWYKFKKRNNYIVLLFAAGIGMLLFSTLLLVRDSWALFKPTNAPFLVLSVLFFALEIYSLFVELPVKTVYVQAHSSQVVDTGTYALCRHPGVLWFGLFYLFLALSFPSLELFAAAVLFTTLDFTYAWLEEKLVFIKSIQGYRDYIQSTPLLIPNKKSIERCFNSFRIKK